MYCEWVARQRALLFYYPEPKGLAAVLIDKIPSTIYLLASLGLHNSCSSASDLGTRNRDAHPADIDAGLARVLANLRYFVHPRRVMDRVEWIKVWNIYVVLSPLLPTG